MADVPSLILKGLGIVLILIGLSGTLGGFYAMKVVHDSGGDLSTATGSIVEIRDSLTTNRDLIDENINEGADNFAGTSDSLTRVGERIDSAAITLGTSASSMNQASAAMKQASADNKDAGDLLEDAALGLTSWSNAYSFNGTSLPQKSSFQSAVDKLEDASAKLQDTGTELESSATDLENSATSLNGTRTNLVEASQDLKTSGEALKGASENFQALQKPSHSIVGEMISPLEDTTAGLTSDGDTTTYIYMLIGYFIMLHIIMLALGVSLVIIEINLFYPIA